MTIKWGWWSFGFSVLFVLLPFLFMSLVMSNPLDLSMELRSGLIETLFYTLSAISAILALTFGIIAIVKRETGSKISFIFAILSIVIVLLVLSRFIFIFTRTF